MSLPIYLIGARGCGKTTVGEALALALGYTFCDTDSFLQQTTEKTVAEIVAEGGWPEFRRYESESLIAVTENNKVIATGGGMVLAEENRQFMRDKGQVIYLHALADVLALRLEVNPENQQRPTLTGKPITKEIADILAVRDTLYRQTAHHIVDAMQEPQDVVKQIASVLSIARAS